jgi:hypothetical protein
MKSLVGGGVLGDLGRIWVVIVVMGRIMGVVGMRWGCVHDTPSIAQNER